MSLKGLWVAALAGSGVGPWDLYNYYIDMHIIEILFQYIRIFF